MINLYKLEIFAVVAREGSFSAAAESLLMSQSAISQHMQALEASLGTALFKRHRRGITLTDAGKTLYDYASRIFRLVAEAENALTNVERIDSGQITIGSTPGVSNYLLPDWVQAFRARYPNLTVTLRTGITPEVVADVLAHRVDLGFVEGELEGQTHLGLIILREVEQFVIIGPKHPWWSLSQVTIADLNGQLFIMRPPKSLSRTWLDHTLRECGIQPRISAEFDNLESIKRSVALSACVAVLPDYAIRHEREMGLLRALPVNDKPLRRSLKLIWDQEALFSPIARAFLDFLKAEFPQLTMAVPGANGH